MSNTKVLICDLLGVSKDWLEQFAIKDNMEIVGKISLEDRNQVALLHEKSWDYLLVFEQGQRQFLVPMFHFLNISDKRVIYAQDINSWLEHPSATFALVNPTGGGGIIYRHLLFHLGKQLNYFTTCTTSDDLNYIATSKDDFVIKPMYLYRKNHAEDEMKFFHELANHYYQIDDNSGLFLDLGANIGTTGIYFTKKIAPNLKLIAFEPDPENFKLLRANLIFNDLEEKSTAENLGLGIEESEQTMYRDIANPGHNGMFSTKDNTESDTSKIKSETIKIISLDKYFTDKNLNAEEIRYIWIDTEGFEPQVLLGAREVLTKNPAPIFMEFNPQYWQKSGFYEKMIEFLTPIYSSYVWIPEAMRDKKINAYPLEKLFEFQNSTAAFGALGDIFLIKKS